jgi:selenide,water dikinase
VHPDKVLTNRTARAGDVLILTKPLGVGVLSAAFKQERLDAAGYAALIASTTQLNAVGRDLADQPGVHAVTDVTGFGLLGHALELCRGAGLTAEIGREPPLLTGVEALARAGIRTGASTRNWASYGDAVRLPAGMEDWRRDLLTDPQTSGGLLISVAAEEADAVLALVRRKGFTGAAVVGRLTDGPAQIHVA